MIDCVFYPFFQKELDEKGGWVMRDDNQRLITLIVVIFVKGGF